MVIALAVVYYFAFVQQLSFEEIIVQIALFTSNYLVIEFIERFNVTTEEFLQNDFEWYMK